MARSTRESSQAGNVTLHNGHWTLRYRQWDAQAGKWKSPRIILKDPKTGQECTSEKQARNVARAFMVEVNERNNDPHLLTKQITFAEFETGLWQHYMDKRKVQVSSRHTYKMLYAAHIAPAFGERAIIGLTPETMSKYFAQLAANHSPSVCQNVYLLLHVMLEVACQNGLIEQSPIRRKLHKPHYVRPEKPTLPPETIKQIILTVPPEYRTLLTTIAITGIRIGEALALWWENVSFEAGSLSVTHTQWGKIRKVPKTRGSQRTIHLPPALMEMLRQHRQESAFTGRQDYVFPRADGKAMIDGNFRDYILYPAMDSLGIERRPYQFGCHLLRHSAGTRVYEVSRDLKLVQMLLGHATVSFTADCYVHPGDEITGEATRSLAEGMNLEAEWLLHKATDLLT